MFSGQVSIYAYCSVPYLLDLFSGKCSTSSSSCQSHFDDDLQPIVLLISGTSYVRILRDSMNELDF